MRLKRAGVPVEHRAARTKPEIAAGISQHQQVQHFREGRSVALGDDLFDEQQAVGFRNSITAVAEDRARPVPKF